jgi:coenzyme PQQ biosynthesis protein PqqD
VIDAAARPRLAPKARLRFDRHSGKSLLLFPERGLSLNETGAEILALCTGEATVAQIIDALCVKYGEDRRHTVTAEVNTFLAALAERNLLRGLEP